VGLHLFPEPVQDIDTDVVSELTAIQNQTGNALTKFFLRKQNKLLILTQ
jgi:hypothetical protein